MKPVAKRKSVGFLTSEIGLSERRACRIVGLARSVQQYRPVPKDDAAVVKRMKELASENRRYGYLRLHAMLRREGLVLNAKRTYRLYTEQGLQVRTKEEAQAAPARPGLPAGAGAADAAVVVDGFRRRPARRLPAVPRAQHRR